MRDHSVKAAGVDEVRQQEESVFGAPGLKPLHTYIAHHLYTKANLLPGQQIYNLLVL